jgi:hypothetical protein
VSSRDKNPRVVWFDIASGLSDEGEGGAAEAPLGQSTPSNPGVPDFPRPCVFHSCFDWMRHFHGSPVSSARPRAGRCRQPGALMACSLRCALNVTVHAVGEEAPRASAAVINDAEDLGSGPRNA